MSLLIVVFISIARARNCAQIFTVYLQRRLPHARAGARLNTQSLFCAAIVTPARELRRLEGEENRRVSLYLRFLVISFYSLFVIPGSLWVIKVK